MAFNLTESHAKTSPRFDSFYLFFLGALHVGAVASLFFFSWQNLAVFFLMYGIAGIGITVGYHRLLTHRSFKTPKFIERIFAIMGNIAMEGSPTMWVATHRQHHLESDTKLDPHDINKGFWHAHMGWIFFRYPSWYEQGQKDLFAPDLQKDGFYQWMDKYPYVFAVLTGTTLFVIGGLPMFLWGFCLRHVILYHSTWFVNSAAHMWGSRPFSKELATNNWWVALLALGEGWHNNHHAFPTSAKHGLRKWQFDISWILIWTMSKLGLAEKVRTPRNSELPWKKSSPKVANG
jgi:fatty-acid desaturase